MNIFSKFNKLRDLTENPLTKYVDYHLYLSSNENHFNKISSFPQGCLYYIF